jgi:hypothetical protein
MAGKYLRGALISFSETFPIPVPNIIVFQFNPETMTHGWTPAAAAPPPPPPSGAGAGPATPPNPLAVTGAPGETFTFTLKMDANEMEAEGGVGRGLAVVSGVYTRLAALEMLLFPVAPSGGGLVGAVSAALGGGGGPLLRDVPGLRVPTCLFVWGPGRIVPVRLTSLSITEQLYHPILLHPIHAEAAVGLRVLTPDELNHLQGPLRQLSEIAYDYSQGLREALAIANLANAAESVIGLLPI